VLGDAMLMMAEKDGGVEMVTKISLTQAPIHNRDLLVGNDKKVVLMMVIAPKGNNIRASMGDDMTATRANSMTAQKGKDKITQMANDKTAQMAQYNKTAQAAAAQMADKKTVLLGK